METHPLGMAEYQLLGDGFGYHSGYAAAGSGGSGQPPGQPGSQPTSHQAGQSGVLNSAGLAGPGSQAYHQLGPHGGPPVRQLGYGPGDPGKIHDQYSAAYGSSSAVGSTQSSQLARSQYGPHDPRYQHNLSSYASSIGQSHLGLSQHPNAPPSQSSSLGQLSSASYQSRSLMGQYPDQRMHGPGLTPRPGGPVHGLPGHYPGSYSSSPYGHPGHSSSGDLWSSQGLQHMQQRPPYYPNAPHPPSQSGGVSMHGPRGQSQFVHNQNDYSAMHQSQRPYYQGSGTGSQGPQSSAVASHIPGESSAMSSYSSSSYNAPSSAQSSSRSSHSANSRQQSQAQFSMSYNAPNSALQPPPPSASQQTVPTQGSTANVPRYPHQQYSGYSSQTNYDSSAGQSRLSPYGLPPSGPQGPNSPSYRPSYPSSSAQVAALSPRRPTPTPPAGSPMPPTSHTPDRVTAAAAAAGASTTPQSQGYPSPGANQLTSPNQGVSPSNSAAGSNSQSQPPVAPPPPPPPTNSLQQLEQMVMPHLSSSGSSSKTNSTSSGPPSSSAPTSSYYGLSTQGSGSSNSQLSQSSSQYSHYSPPTSISHQQPSSHSYYQQYQQNSGLWQASGNQAPPTSTSSSSLPNTHSPLGTGSGVSSLQPQAPVPYSSTAQVSQQPATKASLQSPQHTNSSGSSTSSTSINTNVTSKTSASNMSNSSTVGAQQYNMFDSQFATNSSVADSGFSKSSASENSVMSPRQGISQQSQQQSSQQQSQGPQPPSAQQQPAPPQSMSSFDISSLTKPNASYETSNTQNQKSEEQDRKDSPRDKEYSQKQKTGESQSGSNADQPTNFYDVLSPADTAPMSSESIMSRENQKQDQSSVTGNQTTQPPISNDQPPFMSQPVADQQNFLAPHQGDQSYMSSQPQQPGMYHPQQPYGHQHQSQMPPYGSNYGDSYDMGMGNEPMNSMNAPYGPSHESMMYDQGYNQPGMESMMGPGGHMGDYGGGHMGDMSTMPPYDPYDDTFASEPSTKRKGKGRPKKDPSEPKKEKKPRQPRAPKGTRGRGRGARNSIERLPPPPPMPHPDFDSSYPMGPDSADLYSQMMPQPPPMPQHQMPGPPPMGQPPPPPSMQASIQQQQMNHSMQPPPHMPGSMTQVPNDIYQPPNLNQAALQSQQNSSQLQMALEPPNVFDAVSPQTQHAQSTALVPTSQLQSQPQPSAASLPPSTQQPQLTQDQQQPQTQSQQQPLSTPPSQLQQQPHSDTDIQAFDGDATTIQPDNHEASAETTASTKTQSASATVDHVNNNSENTATEQMQCDDLFSQSTNSNSLETPMFTVSSEDTSNTVPPSSQPEPLPSLQCDPQPKSPTPQLPSLPIATPPPPPPQLPPPLVPVSSPGNGLNSSSFDFAEESTTVATPTKKKGKKRKAKDEACLGSGEEVERKPKKVKKRKSKSQQEQNKEEIDVKIENPLSDVLPDGDKSVVEPQSTEFDDATQEDTSQLDFNAGETSAKAKKGRNREGKTKKPKLKESKSKLPKKKLPKLALKFGKKKKRKRLGSSDNSDLERTPPPSPDEAESGILKRRSARNTKRQKYTDDIDLEISEDESKLGLKDKEGGSLQDTSPQAGVLLMNVHEDAMVVEKFLGVRMATREVESENVEGDENPNPTTVEVEEFYVKYKNLSYLHCEWKTEEELEKGDKRIAQKIKRFKQKKDSMNMFDFLDDEPFNPDYCEVDRILDVNEVEEWVDIVEEVKPKCEEKKEEVKEPEEDVKKTEEKLENESQDEPIKSEVENADAVLDEELIEKSSSVVEEKQEKSNSSETEEPKKESNSEEEPDVKTPEEKIEEKSIMDEAVTETIKKDTETKKPKIVRHYLVKWRALPYEECNWELEDDLDPQKIELFWRFRDPPPKDKWKPKKRPKMTDWKKLDVSPVYRSGNTLREYQLEGVNWLMFCWHNNRNCILADEMGLGKTIQSLAFVQEIVKYGINGPFLVIAPLSTIGNWQREFETWTDLNVITYHGSSASRNMLQEYEMYYKDAKGERIEGIYKFQVMITTFEIILTDCMELRGISWRCCIIDEAHRLKNRNCKLLEGLRLLDMEHRVLLTGTPLQNNVEELFSLLNFLEPSQFASSEVFLLEFGDLKTEEQVDKLKALLKPMMLRRLKEDVEKSLAPKEETIIEVELTNIQKKYYRAILERNFQFLSKGGTCANMPNLMNTMMELRKCCIHPFLINGAEEQVMYEYKHQHGDSPESQLKAMVHASGKLVLIDKLLPRLRSDGHRVLIFSQMVRCLDILEDYIVQKRYPYERIDGRVRGNLRQAAIDRFCKPDSDRFVFLLCTRAGGLGINLTAADTVIIFDSDWNPQNDLQAQARCHRIGQSKMVKVYRLICRNTYEREMFDKASLKLGLDKAVLQSMNTQKSIADNAMSKKEVEDLLRKGAYGAIMDDDNAGDKFCEEDIEQILQRRTRVITVESEEQGSIFSKASFAASDNRSDIEIDDPNFWEKWAKKAQLDVDELKGRNELIVQEPRKRTQTKRFGQDDSLMDITDVDSSEDDEDVAMRTRGSRGRLKGKKGRKGRGGGYERERDEDYLEEFGPGNWTRAECYKVEKGLLTYGWARWPEFVKFGNFRRQLSEQDIEDIARVILLFCVQNYKGDEKIKSFIWDLISPVEQNSQKGNKNLGGLTASLSRGRKNKKSKRSIAEEVMSSDWAKDENYNPDFLLTDDQYRKHLHRHANKILLRVRLLNYLKQEIIGDLSEMVEVGRHAREIPIPTPMADGDPPSTWWDEEADRSLLIGVYKHGYDRYNLMRHDPALCFLHRCGPPDNAALYAEINDDDLGRTLDEDEEPETPATPATPSDSTKSESVKDDMEANDMSNGSLPFPSHADMNQRFRRIITAYQRNFKKQELRLAQQARHQQRLEKLERFEAAIKERESKKREQAQKKWSRREESDFYRVVSSFGVEYNRREDKYDWSRFRSFSRLEKKLDETLTEYFKAFYAMCKRVTGRRLTEEEENLPISVDPISDERASRSLARIDLLSKIREEILPHPELNERLQLCQPSIELPDWWICGQHDKDLLIGAARYGLNRLDFHLMHDPEFSFKDVLKNEDSDSKQKDMDNSLLNKDVKESDEIKTAVAEEPVPEVDDIKQQEVLDKEIKNEPLEEKSEKETVKESDSLEKIDKSSSDDEKKEPATEEDREKPKQEEQSEKVEPEKLETDDTATGVTKDMAPVDSEHVETEDPVPKESTKDEESAPSKEMVEATSQPDIKTADEKMEVDNDMTKDPAFKNSAENEDEKKENTEDEKVSVESNMKTEPVFDPPSDIKAIVKVSGDELQHSLASVSQVRTPIRWPKDRVLQMRLEQVCHCVEKNEWQSFRQAFFTGLTGTVPSTPSIATADSSPRAASPGSISSVSREPTPHPTPEHTPRRESLSPLNDYMFESGGSATDSANRRRRRRRKRFEVEAERAKLRNLLSQGIEQQSSKKSNPMSTPLTSSLLNPSLFPPLFNLPFCNMRPDLRNELLNDEKTAILIGNALNQIQSKPPNSASGPPPAHQNSASRRTNPLDTLDLRFKTTPAIVPPPNSAPPAHKPTITTNSSSNKEKPSAKPSSPISVLDLSSGPSAKREPDHKNESGDGNRNVSNVSKKPASKKIGSRIDALALNLQAKKMMQEKQTDRTENAPHGEGKTPQTDVRSKDSFGKLDLNKYQTRQARYPTPPAAHSSSMPTSKLSENHNFIKSQTPSSQLSSLDATKLPPSKASEASSILEQAAAIRQDLKKWLEDHPEFVAANPSLAAAAAAAMSFTPNVSSIPANTELLELPEGRRRGRRPKVDPTQLDVQHLTGDENVSVINRLTGKKITGSKAPPLKHLAEWLEKNPMFDVDPKWSPLIREKVPSFKTPTNVSSTSSIRTRTSDRRLNDMNMASSSVSGGGSSSRRTTAASLLAQTQAHSNAVSSAGASSSTNSTNFAFPHSAMSPLNFNPSLLSGFPSMKMFMDSANMCPTTSTATSSSSKSHTSSAATTSTAISSACSTSSSTTSTTTPPMFFPFGGLAGMGLGNPLFGFPGFSLPGLTPGSNPLAEFTGGKKEKDSNSGSNSEKSKSSDKNLSISKSKSASSGSNSNNNASSLFGSGASSSMGAGGLPFLYPTPNFLYNPLGLGGFSLPTSPFASLAAQTGLMNGLGGLGTTAMSGLTTTTTTTSSANHSKSRNSSSSSNAHKNSSNSSSKHYSNAHGSSLSNLPTSLPFSASANVLSSSSGNASKGATLPESDDDSLKSLMGNDEDDENDVNGDLDEHETGGKGDSDSDYEKSISRKRSSSSKSSSKDLSKSKKSNNSAATSKVLS